MEKQKKKHKPVAGRANTDEEKREFVERILMVWLKNPALRFGQLTCLAADKNTFNIEDEELIEWLEKNL